MKNLKELQLKMTKKTKETEQQTGSGLKLTGPQKLWIGFGAVLLVLALLIVGIWQLKTEMFEENEHFILQRTAIDLPANPGGYWNSLDDTEKRVSTLCSELGIIINRTNIFELDLPNMRRNLLEWHPEIQEIQIIPVLPDTLNFKIVERIPVVNIGPQILKDGSGNGPDRLVDDKGTVVSSVYYEYLSNLPRIKDETDPVVASFTFGDTIKNDGIVTLIAFAKLLQEAQLTPHTICLKKTEKYDKHIETSLTYKGVLFSKIIFKYSVNFDELRTRILPGLQQVLENQNGNGSSTIRTDINGQWIVEP